MKSKLLVIAVLTSLISANDIAFASPLWVDIGEAKDGKIWIDQQSIARYKSVVKFDMKVTGAKLTSARVVAEYNTLTFQYQNLAVNNVASLPPDSIEFPIRQTEPDSVLGTAIYYACATYVR